MPDWQNRGLGTTIIQDVIDRLRAPGIPVRLQVLKVNPARRLYERLGFEIYDESDTHYLMQTNDPNFAR
jgi:ribosomal protein S18 acetylase RimI-like enzyme